MKLFGNSMKAFALTVFVLGASAQVFAYDDSADQCEMPKTERMLIASLDLALRQTNFSDCRIETTEDGMSFDHGDIHGWIRFSSRRTQVLPVGNEVVLSGSRYSDDGNFMYEDKLTFIPGRSSTSLSEVIYVQSQLDHRNTGSLAHPSFETVSTPLMTIHCKAD